MLPRGDGTYSKGAPQPIQPKILSKSVFSESRQADAARDSPRWNVPGRQSVEFPDLPVQHAGEANPGEIGSEQQSRQARNRPERDCGPGDRNCQQENLR